MATKIKINNGPKVLLALLVVGGGIFGAKYYLDSHGSTKMASVVPAASGDLENFKDSQGNTPAPSAAPVSLPSTTLAKAGDREQLRLMTIEWNAVAGLSLANGGKQTTEGSLMDQRGVNLKIERQDDYSKMQESLVACANQMSQNGKTCHGGVQFAVIMGDGGPAFLAGLNDTLGKIGPDFKAEIVGSVGRSNGEDAFMAPPAVQADAQKARGLLVAGVLKDGDWNIAMFWARQNQICNNPDVSTYDPNCLNWVGTSDFVAADEKYIQGACETRKVVSNGKRTGETKQVCVSGVVTWSPGDQVVAEKKGGVVKILSTKENASQMPATIVGIKKFDATHHDAVLGMLGAALQGGDQIKTNATALKKAADIEAAIFGEQTGAYWAKLYRGYEDEDKQGNSVQLGGSRVFNLADNMRYFGLEKDAPNAFAATYNLFGNIAHEQYPIDLATFPAVEDILNTGFIQELAASGATQGKVDQAVFTDTPTTNQVVAQRTYQINFDTGKATIRPESVKELNELLSALEVASNTFVEVHGHTDAAGNAVANQTLSEQRAQSVRQFLQQHAGKAFPEGRVSVKGHGQSEPVADNTTAAGRAKNRRVVIVLKQNE